MTTRTTYKECKYCEAMERWHSTHEDELYELGKELCDAPYWDDILKAEIGFLDHATLGKVQNYRTILNIHAKTGCNCRERAIRVQDLQFLDK